VGNFYNEKFVLKYNDLLLNLFVLQFSVISLGFFEPKPIYLYISRASKPLLSHKTGLFHSNGINGHTTDATTLVNFCTEYE
jgi:hypothetical protein